MRIKPLIISLVTALSLVTIPKNISNYFAAVNNQPAINADVNGNGKANCEDISDLKRYILHNCDILSVPNGDINSDGIINCLDYSRIKREFLLHGFTETSSSVTTVQEKSFDLSEIPWYSGNYYCVVNNNMPYFTKTDYTESFEYYSDLDSLGRCGAAFANVGKDLMPTQQRGDISSVKPTGWHSVRYDNIEGGSLYTRAHLIAHQLTAENANPNNLITGTKYLNAEGMVPFEIKVGDYVRSTGNHVLYRVTPIFIDNNLIASGVLMEAYSVEDSGQGVKFNVFCYNVQPDIYIDYATGDSKYIGIKVTQPSETTVTAPEITTSRVIDTQASDNPVSASYILNSNTKKFHHPWCSSVDTISPKNKKSYTGSRDSLIASGYSPCKRCNP